METGEPPIIVNVTQVNKGCGSGCENGCALLILAAVLVVAAMNGCFSTKKSPPPQYEPPTGQAAPIPEQPTEQPATMPAFTAGLRGTANLVGRTYSPTTMPTEPPERGK